MLNWALVSDTVEYGEWRTGVRSEGTVYTGFTFFRKVSQALAGFFPGIMLTQIGYVPNVVQSSGTVKWLRQLIFIYPSLLAVITIGDGLLLQPQREDVCAHRRRDRTAQTYGIMT